MCPIRPGDPCSLCQPGANGPQDCGLVYLVQDDPDLREIAAEQRRRHVDRARRSRDVP
ncbi:hypothetical protein MOPEL_135_00090 [Mobilicoccus pelagius NBRC 104925]|uniref:Uncharacterized protein n=2 Tax=Mobilicoccus TaxID=984996 RepID=H5UVL3_9MICO|nr:hypothetical protein MOPEL_135_00090 [Mobilicoccus pelagius NBRC 104925]